MSFANESRRLKMPEKYKYVVYHSREWMELFNETVRTMHDGTWGWITWSVDEVLGGVKLAKMIFTKL